MNYRSLLFLIMFLFLFSFNADSQQPVDKIPDVKDLEAHILESLEYPADAIAKRTQGIVCIRFYVDHNGSIIKPSVNVVHSLSPSCDSEAIRVIKLFQKKLDFFPTIGQVAIIYIPIRFQLTDGAFVIDFPRHLIVPPVKTAVIPKPVKADQPGWAVYSKKGMLNVIGRVSPGDSVIVTGWAAWSYFIQGKDITGYVSRNALEINESLDSIANVIDTQSEEEEKFEMKETALAQKELISDTIYNFSSETANLSLTSSKKEVYVGECTIVTFSVNIKENNLLQLQFIALGEQLTQIQSKELLAPKCFVLNNNIWNIEGVERSIANEKYTSYDIYQANYCPTNAEVLNFPTIKLKMLLRGAKTGIKTGDKVAEFNTKPLTVKVKPLPTIDISQNDNFKLIGKFTLEEHVEDSVVTSGKPFEYRVTIKGSGNLFPLRPPKLTDPNVFIQLQDIEDMDTIINALHFSSKTFVYRIMLPKSGQYDFSKKITFNFYDPSSQRLETIQTSLKISADEGLLKEPFENPGNFHSRNHFIVMDASQSMRINDYPPNRLEAVKNGLKEFYHTGRCDIGIIYFGARAIHLSTDDSGKCYSGEQIESISNNSSIGNGTAIADAIWLAIISKKDIATPGKVIVIGDGDNTAGVMRMFDVAQIAKKNKIQVYTIGVGNKGSVPYGKNQYGVPYMIENTFSDRDFKEISRITGGQYLWAKDEKEIAKFLNLIFK